MAGELLLLFLQFFFLLPVLCHSDPVRLPSECLDFDLDHLEDYLSTLNLTEVPAVEKMVVGFQCPITALPFGSLKSDWSRLLLLYEATDVEFKEKLKRLLRILVIVFHRFQEGLVPTRGADSTTATGQFSTVSYSLATTPEEVIKNSTNFLKGDSSTTHTSTTLYELNIKNNVSSSGGWISTTEGNFKNESTKIDEKLTTRAIIVENNETPVSAITERPSGNSFTADSEESNSSSDNSTNLLNSHEQDETSVTEERPGVSLQYPSSKTTVAISVTVEQIPEDVSEVTRAGETITHDEDGNRSSEENSRETKYDNATSGADTVSVSSVSEPVSNSVSARIENVRGDNADFSWKDEDSTFAETKFTYTDAVDLGNSSTRMTTESMVNGSATDNEVLTTLVKNKTNEGNDEVTSVYGNDPISTTLDENSLKTENTDEMKSVENTGTTPGFKDVYQTTYSSENPSSGVIKTSLSSRIEEETPGIPGMNNSIRTPAVISTSPVELKGQRTSEGKVNGSDESTFKSDGVTSTTRTTISVEEVNFPDPSLNSVYKVIRHEPDYLNPVVIGPDHNGSYQTGEHKIKKPPIVKKPPPENPFVKFTKISTSSTTSSWERATRPEVPRNKEQRISLMGSKKRQSFDNDVENQYRWFYKLAGHDAGDNRNEDRGAWDNPEVRCKH